MACFLVSAAEAAIVTVATQIVLAHENKLLPKYRREAEETSEQHAAKIPFSRKLRWLSNLLWGDRSCLRSSMSGTARLFRGRRF